MSYAPFPVTYRELWAPEHIRGTQLPPFRGDAHPVTLTGAQKQTTCDGVDFDGTVNASIVVPNDASQNAQQAFAITIRFTPRNTFAAGAPNNQFLLRKVTGNEWIQVWLSTADGALHWSQGDGGGGDQFLLISTTINWAAGVEHIVTCSMTNTPTQRLIVDGVVQDTDVAAARATPNAGNMIIGNAAAGDVQAFLGTISWVVIGVGTTAATALTVAEEGDLSKGMPPPTAKVQYQYLMDEGRPAGAGGAAIIYNRGSVAVNGQLSTGCSWKWGKVKQAVLSCNGIDNFGQSGATVDIGGDTTYVQVVRMMSTYSALSGLRCLSQIRVDNNNNLALIYLSATNVIRFNSDSAGVSVVADYVGKPAIGDYWIIIGTRSGGAVKLYIQGSLVATGIGGGVMTVGGATAWIGRHAWAGFYDNHKTLRFGLIEGIFTDAQARTYSRWLRDVYNLPISI